MDTSNPSQPEIEAMETEQIVAVTHYMRAAIACEFQIQAAEWLGSVSSGARTNGDAGYEPAFPRNYGPKNAWDLPAWTSSDLVAARWVVRDLTPKQRIIAAELVAAGPTGRWTKALMETAEYPAGKQPSGVFRALSGRCRACGRRPFWNGGPKHPASGQLISVTAGTTAELFQNAIALEQAA